MKMIDLKKKIGDKLGAMRDDSRFCQRDQDRQERMKGELIQLNSEEEQDKELKESEADLGEGEEEQEETEEETEEELLGVAAPTPMRETRQRPTFRVLGNFKLKNKK